MSNDIGFTHIALSAKDIDKSIHFYTTYANMSVMHERVDEDIDKRVVWLSDKTRPFVLVLVQNSDPTPVLGPFAHLGVGCRDKDEVDQLCHQARKEGILAKEATDSGYPVGYWAFIRDPDGHTLEISYGQEIGLTVEQHQA
ncbi:VOC family protein [Vibrio ruber]|uniref:Glyoxalase/Bleomycin resistance protein/Dioxygenase superfamily protein n=1 Tax=Vibrio ruber (strain DSM 16370 / JCM 11486 / BCRC 17186 / CECT 7878 / LMG 23124 / VR1) TaxID=1123498 RepID=A0A1R4LFM8_VIBR1|nr:VOC family protein [Vibrio ruber]WNJ97931.1 VOC family protein [Vibrio ruber]SJN55345.1 Glyoxalase/Bleomycin resistance protein/Dioxygenase superfamily protein [Vibrio ruber DSM 16370]